MIPWWEKYGIVDGTLDGVSLTVNYQSQFGKILRISTCDTLVERMRRRLEQKEERGETT